ncbi:Abi family protein [Rufibacter sp. LB8]|uniref:Abi family protein n=1 Tax=Rufibacter sp. LB8 TaxID=2777781 RepID=UPI00178C3E6C|nr:Abi family protein [Rufibacter sp. LB8]
MSIPYNKPPLHIADQIQKLQSRGLKITDSIKADHCLSTVSYYRLSAYMLPFQVKGDNNHTFLPGTTFDQVFDLYVFDRELRLIIFDAIEKIEVALRTQIIYQLSIVHGAWWFEDLALFTNTSHQTQNLQKLAEEVNRSHEVFIDHYRNKYSQTQSPPAWMSLEVTTMGLLSKIFRNLKMSLEKKAVAAYFGLSPYILESWMQSITYVRNNCAHHSRLWNRTLTIKPTLPNKPLKPWLANDDILSHKLYAFLSCLLYLLQTIAPENTCAARIKALTVSYPLVPLSRMGFHENWEHEVLWSK